MLLGLDAIFRQMVLLLNDQLGDLAHLLPLLLGHLLFCIVFCGRLAVLIRLNLGWLLPCLLGGFLRVSRAVDATSLKLRFVRPHGFCTG